MNRTDLGLFEQEVRALAARSVEGKPTQHHLDETILISLIAGELRSEACAKVDAHLVVCRDCARRFAVLREELRKDEEVLESNPPPHLSKLLEHLRADPQSVERGDSFPRRFSWGRVAKYGLVAAMLAAFLVAWRGDMFQAEDGSIGAPTRLEILQPRGVAEAIVDAARERSEFTAEQLISDLEQLGSYPSWRAIAHGIGLLNRYGVALDSPKLAFEGTTIHIVHVGDTWQSIAADALGDESLWPILVLLNREWAVEKDLSDGAVLRIPQSVPEGELAP